MRGPEDSNILWLVVYGVLASACHPVGLQTSWIHLAATEDARRSECDASTRWVDRIDGKWAVLVGQGGREAAVPLTSLSPDVREGDVLRGDRIDPGCHSLMRQEILRLLGDP